eukprot:TRINITY_DN5179_c0_g1_i8.p1 TRINITY_DN5179_c0_g1~~TRINITY_DN5179_c0_g1_i8.p1  ORF type:complete len:1216 (-),score=348.11 TRINITY_DN5179_c0_g1_i8:626-4273(-)
MSMRRPRIKAAPNLGLARGATAAGAAKKPAAPKVSNLRSPAVSAKPNEKPVAVGNTVQTVEKVPKSDSYVQQQQPLNNNVQEEALTKNDKEKVAAEINQERPKDSMNADVSSEVDKSKIGESAEPETNSSTNPQEITTNITSKAPEVATKIADTTINTTELEPVNEQIVSDTAITPMQMTNDSTTHELVAETTNEVIEPSPINVMPQSCEEVVEAKSSESATKPAEIATKYVKESATNPAESLPTSAELPEPAQSTPQVNIPPETMTDLPPNPTESTVTESQPAKTRPTPLKMPRLSTGQFVNGRYMPKNSEVEVAPNGSAEGSEGDKKRPMMRRFLGGKNKFKPNLFSRSQQQQAESSRGQNQKELANLPDVNNPTRTRRTSNSGDDASEKRKRRNSAAKATVDGTVNETAQHSPPKTKSPSKSIVDSADQDSFVHQLDVDQGNSSVDSPDEMVPESTPDEIGTNNNKETGSNDSRSKNFALLNGGGTQSPSSPAIVAGGRKRRMKSWSGSNSSGDELHRMKGGKEKKPRRRTADGKVPITDRTNYALKRRKIESKRRFSNGVPGRGTMTMFDLIYYNPDNGTELAREEGDEENAKGGSEMGSQPPTPQKKGADLDKSVDLPPSIPEEPEGEEENNAMPVPQVKVGPNGEIILDESSTTVETTASKRARTDLMDSTLVVESANKMTNYGTYSKKRKYNDWLEKETLRFFKALSLVGTDFSMMETLFKKRNRHELKLKFKKEERMNPTLVDKCLRQRGQFTDLNSFIEEESDDDELEEKVDRPTRGRRKAGKLSRRGEARGRKVSSRGMYESSSGGEDADVSETSRSPAARRPTAPGHHRPNQTPQSRRPGAHNVSTPGNRPSSSSRPGSTTAGASGGGGATSTPKPSVSISAATLQKIPGVSFPPALLAANPSLAGAMPGSLVVVASPSKADPSSQLLHVYMVSDKKAKTGHTPPSSATATQSNGGHATTAVASNTDAAAHRQSDDTTPPHNQATGGGGVLTRGLPTTAPTDHRRSSSRSPVPGSAGSRRSIGGGGFGTDVGRFSVDPAVVRAVDKKRANLENEVNHVYKRQRTLSEGSMISPSKLKSLALPNQRYSESIESEPYSRTRRVRQTSGNSTETRPSNEASTASKSNQVQESVVPTTLPSTATTASPISRQKSADEGEDGGEMQASDTQSPLFSRQISGEDDAEMSSSAASQLMPIARKSKPLLVSE